MKQFDMMMLLSGLVGLLLVLTAEARVGYGAGVCSETEQCLLFDRICKNENFEVRFYASAKWVLAIERASSIGPALVEGFKHIDEYFNGANKKGAKIPKPDQVGIRVPIDPTLQTHTYAVIVLLPLEYQEKPPPAPTADKVFIFYSSDHHAYVRSFDGVVTAKTERDTVQSLASDLDRVGAKYEKGFYFVATYGSPLSLTDTRSEVLFVALGDPVCV